MAAQHHAVTLFLRHSELIVGEKSLLLKEISLKLPSHYIYHVGLRRHHNERERTELAQNVPPNWTTGITPRQTSDSSLPASSNQERIALL